jgi:hypothetical protein
MEPNAPEGIIRKLAEQFAPVMEQSPDGVYLGHYSHLLLRAGCGLPLRARGRVVGRHRLCMELRHNS